MVGHFPLTIEVPDAIATQVLNQLFYDLPVSDLPKFRERVLRVTPADIERVARWFIRPGTVVDRAGRRCRWLRQGSQGRRASATSSAFPSSRWTCCPPTSVEVPPRRSAPSDADYGVVRRAVRRSLRRGARRRPPRARTRPLKSSALAAIGSPAPAPSSSTTFEGHSVTGLTEALCGSSRVRWRSTGGSSRPRARSKPSVLVVIDYPDFNFRLMRAIKRLRVPVVYYVCPQLWAWRPRRMRMMKAFVDRALPIFPFEEDLYRREGMDVRFVGHPLVDLVRPNANARRSSCASYGWIRQRAGAGACFRAVDRTSSSGSRPVMAAAVPMIAAQVPDVQFVVARAPHLTTDCSIRSAFQAPHAPHRRRPDRRRVTGV